MDLRLGIQPAKIRLYDIYGDSAAAQAQVRLDIGNLEARGLTLWLSPSHDGAAARRDYFSAPRWRRRWQLDGVLAPDLMSEYDIELDFGSGTLKYLSQDHCDGRVVYWNAPSFATLAMQFHNFQITVPVMVDGHPLNALIDTGSPKSTMTVDTARQVFGLAAGAGLNLAGRLGPTSAPYYTAQMHQLSFEGVRVDNPVLNVIPDLMRDKSELASRTNPATLPQILLGMDVLRKLHLYIAFREKKIYLTEASH